jgi:hypothetical protein
MICIFLAEMKHKVTKEPVVQQSKSLEQLLTKVPRCRGIYARSVRWHPCLERSNQIHYLYELIGWMIMSIVRFVIDKRLISNGFNLFDNRRSRFLQNPISTYAFDLWKSSQFFRCNSSTATNTFIHYPTEDLFT